MKKRICIIAGSVVLAAALAFGAWYCYIPDFSELIEPQTQFAAEFFRNEQLCDAFFQNHMMSQQDEIYTNFMETEQKGDLATGHDVLSESYGLLMLRAVYKNDRAMFDRCNRYLQTNLWNGDILSWRKNSRSGECSSVNAAVDDLRIIQALILGYDTWQDKALYRQARKMAGKLYRHNVQDGYFIDTYDANSHLKVENATLCYQNLYAFRLLGKMDFRWNKVYENALVLLQEGYLGDTVPLYQTRKNLPADTYETEEINSIESLLTVLHLAEVGEVQPRTLEWLKQQVADGVLFSRYDKESGTAATDFQSTAAYAISAIIGAKIGDGLLYQKAVQRMNLYQVREETDEIFGAYGDASSKVVYSFDNLYALLAFCY
ncbi:MAG: hypothetical protein HFI90_06450 [Clostridia bacterium]|nr:hypothetical protein [Clostridia bacterium]